MKKSLTYATIAVLLGGVLMFAPFLAFPVQIKTDTYTEQLSPRNLTLENLKASSAQNEPSLGVTPHHPLDAISVGLMFTFSLVFAFIVSSQLKRRAA